MEEIIDYLCKIYFSRLEAQIYVDLLQTPGLTGYQIAKDLNISRSSIYPALDNMYKRGLIFLLQGDSQKFVAENPKTLLKKLKDEYTYNAGILEEKLDKINSNQSQEKFVNINGFDSCIFKTKELLLLAEKEVIMNIDGGIEIFRDEIKILEKRGVRVIVFSFIDLDVTGLNVELYSHHHCKGSINTLRRIMLVVDFKCTLVADTHAERTNNEWLGVITNHNLMVSIISEHIHHDIYLLLLEKKSQFTDFKQVMLDTMMEKDRQDAFSCIDDSKGDKQK